MQGKEIPTERTVIRSGLLQEILEGSLGQALEGQDRWAWQKGIPESVRVKVDYRCDKMRAERSGIAVALGWGWEVCVGQEPALKVLSEYLLCWRS